MKPVVHYTSGELGLRVRKLFENPKASGQRVVIVAYIGVDYAKFLPNPKGIEIVCSPTPGATSAEAVQNLIEAGGKGLVLRSAPHEGILGSEDPLSDHLSQSLRECAWNEWPQGNGHLG
jgi:hypothetical protein